MQNPSPPTHLPETRARGARLKDVGKDEGSHHGFLNWKLARVGPIEGRPTAEIEWICSVAFACRFDWASVSLHFELTSKWFGSSHVRAFWQRTRGVGAGPSPSASRRHCAPREYWRRLAVVLCLAILARVVPLFGSLIFAPILARAVPELSVATETPNTTFAFARCYPLKTPGFRGTHFKKNRHCSAAVRTPHVLSGQFRLAKAAFVL